MNDPGNKILTCVLILGGGFVAGINTARLLPNSHTDAAWWKVGLAIFIAFTGFLRMFQKK